MPSTSAKASDLHPGGTETESAVEEDAASALATSLAGLEFSKDQQAAQCRLPLLSSLAGVAQLIKDGKARNIICMCGAGISVSAGIPDFRTPGTGLFSKLENYNVTQPEQLFHIEFFKRDPRPFHVLAKELFPGQFRPSPTHHFMRLLHDKGVLLRCYTQNIDSLESVAGLPKETVIAAHGNFDSAHCVHCGQEYPITFFKAAVDQDVTCFCTSCNSLVKPDIVFYGEDLPERFFKLQREDFPKCDLLIVLGTSLVVYPFAGLIYRTGPKVPRLLINRELVGDFDPEGRKDSLYLGDCDDAAWELATLLGWQRELADLVAGSKGNAASPKHGEKIDGAAASAKDEEKIGGESVRSEDGETVGEASASAQVEKKVGGKSVRSEDEEKVGEASATH